MSFWAYLWGIETTTWAWRGMRVTWVLSLPMRNWNPHWRRTLLVVLRAFWAYLWGIETLLAGWCGSETRVGFEPTYEELKLLLKPLHEIFDLSFEPTYEELKLKKIVSYFLHSEQFWAYLWGIETPPFCLFHRPLSTFWAYLWGIETHHISALAFVSGQGFEPTYEELKLT